MSDSRVTLADIATIEAAEGEAEAIGMLPVGASPAPGARKEFAAASILATLRHREEIKDTHWQGSEKTVVLRKGIVITQERLQEIVAEYLHEQRDKLPQTEIRFTSFRSAEGQVLPDGELSWTVTPSRPGIIGSSSFSIFFRVDDKPAGNCVVRGKLEAIADIPVASVTLHKGDIITEDKFTVERKAVAKLDKPILTGDQVIGMQVTRTISAGRAIDDSSLALPPIIKEGELVKILAAKGQLQISTNGLAKADGRLGEIIRVKNISSNKLIYGRVDGPGIVSVEF